MHNENSSVTRRWMEEVWNKGREEAIDEMLDPNGIVHGIDDIKEPGPKGFKIFFRNFKQQFPEIHIVVEDVLVIPGYESSRCLVEATTAEGQQVKFSGMTFIQVKEDKIVEAWNNFDFLAMYQQLGFEMVQPQQQATTV